MKKALALVLALTMAMSLAACGGTPAPASSGGTGSAANVDAAMYPGTSEPDTVVVNITSEPPEMNSITTTDATAINLMRHVGEGLTALDASNKAVPGVAESWTTSEDGLTWTFNLRKDSVWSNGEPVTAHDFVFSITRLFTPEAVAPYAGTWATYIKGAAELLSGEGTAEGLGVKAVDDYTLEITLNAPCSYFANLMAFPNFYPMNEKFYTEMGMEDGYALDMDKMLFNGPYVMSEWQHDDHVTLTKNDKYWDKANRAQIPTIKMVMITDTNTGLSAFQAGDIDMIGLSGEQVKMLTAEGADVKQYADGTPAYLEFNVSESASSPAMANAKVRRAITLAIDAESYCRNVAQNSYMAADGMVPPVVGNGKYTEKRGSLIERPTDGDYTEVKALFEEGCKEAGVDPASLDLKYITDEGDSAYKMAAFIQEQLQQNLGLKIHIESMPFKQRLDAQSNKQFDICLALWGPDYDDAMTYLDMFVTDAGNNHTGWSNAEYDKLIEAAYAEGDPEKHQEIMIEAEKLLMEEMPIGPIYFRVRDYITSAKFSGVIRNAFQDGVMTYATLN